MISGSDASVTADQLLLKLEKEGVSRQTIAKGFSLEDFYGFAEKYIPAESLNEAKVWLKGLYESIQGLATSNAKATKSANGGAKESVPAKRGSAGVSRTRTQSESNPTNI